MGRDQTERCGGAGAVLAYMETAAAASKQTERAATPRCAPPPASTSKPSGDDAGALAAEIDRCGLVRHGDAFSSRHKGVSWDKPAQTS